MTQNRTYKLALLAALIPPAALVAIIVCSALHADPAAYNAIGLIGSVGTVGAAGGAWSQGIRHVGEGSSTVVAS